MNKHIFAFVFLMSLLGCEKTETTTPNEKVTTVTGPGYTEVKVEPLPPPRLQEVYNCRVDTVPYQTAYVKGSTMATIIQDTKTGKEYIITNVGGIVEIK
jgi:hypothetical protein